MNCCCQDQRHALDYPGCVSFVAFPSRGRAERDETRLKRSSAVADPEDKRELGGTHGFLVIARMDKRTLDFVWIVLARLRAQAEENQAARNMEPALPLLASAGRRFLPFGSAGGALRMVGCTRCSSEPCRGMDLRSADRRRRGCRIVGPLASWRQLERSRHPQRGNWSGVITLKEGHELIRTGPYRTIRHPIYTGILLALLGTAVAMGEMRGLLAVAVAWLSFYWKARREESFLTQEFGEKFEAHAKQTGMFLPRMG